MSRGYRLGRRQPAVDQTARSIVGAARRLVAEKPSSAVTVAEIARQAGVSRITVYNRFGSREGVLRALTPANAPLPPTTGDPREALRRFLETACSGWAADPSLFRHLPSPTDEATRDAVHELAEKLAAADDLRPGCSLREAEDVIGALSSFEVFDRLHKDGRRSHSAVTDVLMRLAAGILA